jgi:hypothetical protein
MDQLIASRSDGILPRSVEMTAVSSLRNLGFRLGAHRALLQERGANCNPGRPPYRRRAE